MKSWLLSLVVFIISVAIFWFTDMSLLVFLLIGGPLILILATYITTSYSFRDSLKPEAIPGRGYDSRIRELNADVEAMKELGFVLVDYFYLKIVPDALIYVFRHKEEPIYYCLYHFGGRRGLDIVTKYGDGFSLTTNNKTDAGLIPRPPRSFLQIFRNEEKYKNLLMYHRRAHRFLLQQRLWVHDFKPADFRHYFMESFREQATKVRSIFLWPVVLIFRMVTSAGRVYFGSIQDQYSAGKIKIWE